MLDDERALTSPITLDECIAVIPSAEDKLKRIIQREGDADGMRLEIDYLMMLIQEAVMAERIKKGAAERV